MANDTFVSDSLINRMIDHYAHHLEVRNRLAPDRSDLSALSKLIDLVDAVFKAQDHFSKVSSKYHDSVDDIEIAMLRDAHMKMSDAFRALRLAVR